MYPPGFATRVSVKGPAEADLEDRFRPHFFGGVATVVAKLFTQCRPDYAMFGEKDYQQLRTVTRMAADLDLRVEVVGVPTVREEDGLAMSSRNAYLDGNERNIAPTLYRVLRDSASRIAAGEAIARVVTRGRKRDRGRGLRRRLSRGAQRRDARARRDARRRSAAPARRRPPRQDAAHRQRRGVNHGPCNPGRPPPAGAGGGAAALGPTARAASLE